MSILRQNEIQEIVIDRPKALVYAAFKQAGNKMGKVTGGMESMGTLVLKGRGDGVVNSAVIRVSMFEIDANKTRVEMKSDSLDGLVGCGSAGKAIDRLTEEAGCILFGTTRQKTGNSFSGLLKAVLIGLGIFILIVIWIMAELT